MLVSEMNSPTVGRSLTQHRKIAVNFRDASLYMVFQLALAALRHLHGTAADEKLKEQVGGWLGGCGWVGGWTGGRVVAGGRAGDAVGWSGLSGLVKTSGRGLPDAACVAVHTTALQVRPPLAVAACCVDALR